jgi:nitrite reductase (NADH) small subunit
MTRQYHVGPAADIKPGKPVLVKVDTHDIGVFRVADKLMAWRNVCPHHAAPVCRGTVAGTNLPSKVHEYKPGREGEILQCPWHGWEFDLLTGEHLAAGSRARLRRYPVEVTDGEVYLELPDATT